MSNPNDAYWLRTCPGDGAFTIPNAITFEGALTFEGAITFEGALTFESTLTIGANGAPAGDFVWYGTTAGYLVTFDADGDTNGSILIGADTKGLMFKLFGDVTGCGVFWDPSGDTNGTLAIGASGGSKGVDVLMYGATSGNYLQWDQSADDLKLVGTATQLTIAGTTDSTSVSTGSLNTAGGLGVAKDFFLGGDMSIAAGKKITTVAELTLNSVDPLTIQIGGVDSLQMDEAAIASFAAAGDIAGHAVYIETEDGGTDGGSASTGQAGGLLSLKTGDGSAAVTTGAVGGAGGALTLTTGVGNTGETAGNGGVGGDIGIVAGAGGASGAGAGDGGKGGDITLTPGAGGGAGGGTAGPPGDIIVSTGVLHFAVQTIDMADNPVTLTLNPSVTAGTLLIGNVLYVDANSGANENLLLPPEADCTGLLLIIENTGGETINVQDDAGGAVVTLETANVAYCTCDGSSWNGTVGIP